MFFLHGTRCWVNGASSAVGRRRSTSGSRNRLCVMPAPVNGLTSVARHTLRMLRTISLVTTRSAHRANLLLRRFKVGTQLFTLRSRGRRRGTRALLTGLRRKRGVTLISSTKAPLVGSPNCRLIHAYHRTKVHIIPLPKPYTTVATLDTTNLPSSHFYCRNFLPTGSGNHHSTLGTVRTRPHALVFCRSARHLLSDLRSVITMLNRSHCIILTHRLAGA